MGLCIYCMQKKPVTAMKCPHCHSQADFGENVLWTVVHAVAKVVFLIVILTMFFQCAAAQTIDHVPYNVEVLHQ